MPGLFRPPECWLPVALSGCCQWACALYTTRAHVISATCREMRVCHMPVTQRAEGAERTGLCGPLFCCVLGEPAFSFGPLLGGDPRSGSLLFPSTQCLALLRRGCSLAPGRGLQGPGGEPSCVSRVTGGPLTRLGADLLKMSRDDLVQICGPADGIRLFNAIKGRWVSVQLAAGVAAADSGVPWARAEGMR